MKAKRGEAMRWYNKNVDLETDECIIFPFMCPIPFVQLACRKYHGPSNGLFACHGPCHNPKCINYRHLYWCTPRQNALDKKRDGTVHDTSGMNNGRAKLTPEQVFEIKELYSSGDYSLKELAFDFDVSLRLINLIVKGLIWKHLQSQPKKDLFS